MVTNPKSVLYEINAHTYLHKLQLETTSPVTLATIPKTEFDRFVDQGIQIVWLMGVWQRSEFSKVSNQKNPEFKAEVRHYLTDVTDEDFIGSAYSIQNYVIDESLGGLSALQVFRSELNSRGIILLLDFVPNHTGPDHPWVTHSPEFFIQGTEKDLEEDPKSFKKCGEYILAHGRDPQYPAWQDVIQVNAFSEGYRQAAIETLENIASVCDGVRCDMAMLLLNDIFQQVWGERAGVVPDKEFWLEVIEGVRKKYPEFLLMAEAYWGTEATLLNLGFDYCYDKTLYDHLFEGRGKAITAYLEQSQKIGTQLVRFIENHDEQRAASDFEIRRHKAAATLIATTPGMTFWHDGQFEGNRVRVPVQLRRGPKEKANREFTEFYEALLRTAKAWNLGQATWRLLQHDAGEDVITYQWKHANEVYYVLINYAPHISHIDLHVPNTNILIDELTKTAFHVSAAGTLSTSLDPWQVLLLV